MKRGEQLREMGFIFPSAPTPAKRRFFASSANRQIANGNIRSNRCRLGKFHCTLLDIQALTPEFGHDQN